MEIHKTVDISVLNAPSFHGTPYEYFVGALNFVNQYYSEEKKRYESLRFEDLTANTFYEEAVWVIHATGFSAKAVGKFMPKLLPAYGSWVTLSAEPFDVMFSRVKLVCNNEQKAKAVKKIADIIKAAVDSGWQDYKSRSLDNVEKLVSLPYIGKVTAYHLGRNIGLLESVKPDLHLVRMAEHWGMKSSLELVESIQEEHRKTMGEYIPKGIIDLCLWYSASTFGTLGIRKEGDR